MTKKREQEAVSAYLNFLKNKGASDTSLKRCEKVLKQLEPNIANFATDSYSFRLGVDNFLGQIDKSEWPFALQIVREYFPFWSGNMKLIAALNFGEAFHINPVQWQTLDLDLKTVWANLKNEKFSHEDILALKAYTEALNKNGADKALIETRTKLVKLLLLRLKGVTNKNSKIYRKAADATLPVFEIKEMRYLFLIVVREFYHFWIGDPKAANYIIQNT